MNKNHLIILLLISLFWSCKKTVFTKLILGSFRVTLTKLETQSMIQKVVSKLLGVIRLRII